MRFNWQKIIIVLFVGWGFSAVAWAAAPKPLSLREAILLALRYNPSVQNAEIQRVIDKFNLRLAENALEVQYALTGGGSYDNSRSKGLTSQTANFALTPSASLTMPLGTTMTATLANTLSANPGESMPYSPSATITVKQPLWQGVGEMSPAMIGLFNARLQEKNNQLSLKNTVMNVITQVISQYIALVQAENTVASQRVSLATAQKNLEQYQALIQAGRNAPADLAQPQADLANQTFTLQQSLNNVQLARQNLLNILGLDPNLMITVPKRVNFPNEKIPSLTASIKLVLANNIGYQQQLISFESVKKSLAIAEDAQRWQVTLSESSSIGNDNSKLFGGLTTGNNTSHSVNLELSIPIDNYSLKSQLLNAKIGLEQAKTNLTAAKRQIETQVIASYNSLISQQKQLEQAKEAVQLAEKSLEIAKVKQQYGRITPFEVISLQNAVLNAQLAEINSQVSYLQTLASFDELLGITLERWQVKIRY